MQRQAQQTDRLRVDACERCGRERLRVRCMIGTGARGLEPCDIGEIGQSGGRLECGDEIAEIVAIGVQDL